MFERRHRTLAPLALVLVAALTGWAGAVSARAADVHVRPSAVAYAGPVGPAALSRRLLLGGRRRATLRGQVAPATALPAAASLRVSLRRLARVRVWAGCGRAARVVLRRSVRAGRAKLPVGLVSGRTWCLTLATDRRVTVDGPRSANPPVLVLAQARPAARTVAPRAVTPRPAAPKPSSTPAPKPAPAPAPAPSGGTPFIMAPTSFWNARLPANVAIDQTATAAAAADLPGEITPGAKAYINTTMYSSPITVVEPTTPRVPVQLMAPSWNGVVPRYDLSLAAVLQGGVPIPAGYQPAPATDTDAEAVFYCPHCTALDGKLGVLWELWRLRKTAGGGWTAQFAGRMTGTSTNPGHWVDRANGAVYPALPKTSDAASSFESRLWGATATSLPLAAGEIRVADVQRGYIDHTLGLAVLDSSLGTGFRWPAQRGDGWRAGAPLQDGMRLRLPANYVIPASLSPVARMIARAARDYGLVLWDRSGALSFRAEPGVRPYFGAKAPSSVLDGFPWGRLEVMATGSDHQPNPTG